MADNNQIDFSMKPMVDPASIASVIQRKKQIEIDSQQRQKEQRIQEFGQLIQAVQVGSNIAGQMVERQKSNQKQSFVNDLASHLSSLRPADASFGPLTQSQAAMPQMMADAVRANPEPFTTQLAKQAFPDNKTNTPSAWSVKTINGPDGNLQYARVNELTGEVIPIQGATAAGMTEPDRQQMLRARDLIATGVSTRTVANEGDKLAAAVDPTKLKDYDRLTAGKRLDAFIQSTGGKATRQQVVEASSLLASMLQGGGRGSVVAEGLIEQLTPNTVKGKALDKLQWLTNHPQDVDQGKFLDLFQKTAIRESQAAEDNIRQQQSQALQRFKHVKRLDPERYNDILQGTGLTEEEINKGQFKRTSKTKSVLPNYDASKSGMTPEEEAAQFLKGFGM